MKGPGPRSPNAEVLVNGRPSLVLENEASRLVVDLLGGSFVDFHFRDTQLNPLVWNNEGPSAEPRQMSHFLCLDRWGWPSEAEMRNGMPYHGEAALVEWRVEQQPALLAGCIRARMHAHLPLANLDVRRWIAFGADGAFFTVTEQVTNRNRLGCVLNMVQHPSIGPPFLEECTVVDASGGRGFVLAAPKPDPEQRSAHWPYALDRNGQPVDMRYLKDDHDPEVVAYAVDSELGWATAANAARGLLIGYLWHTAEYPWLNMWRRAREGKPFARGLEFGTTGLDWPHAELVRKGQIFGRPLVVFLDAGEVVTKSFTCFLIRVPSDYAGVGSVARVGEKIVVTERDRENPRRLTISSVPEQALVEES